MSSDYDVIVVGAGMFGSAAAKHIRRLQPSLRVAVVGPDNNSGPLARGQHYDEARICRRLEMPQPLWAYLDDLGCLSYRETEATSGIEFYTPCGCLWIATPDEGVDIVRCLDAVVQSKGGADAVPFAVVHDAAAAEAAVAAGKTSTVLVTESCAAAEAVYGNGVHLGQFVSEGHETHFIAESGAAGGGTVHPTRYVEAQLACAAAVAPAACFAHVKEVVVHIERVGGDGGADGDGAACVYAVKTDAERTYRAPRVLVATASFAKYHQLLPTAVTDHLKPTAADVVLLRVQPPHGDDHTANVAACAKLPSMIRTTGAPDDQFYALPPRYYAEKGGWYVKMGRVNGPPPVVKANTDVTTLKGAMQWYDEGKELDAYHPSVTHLATMLEGVYPGWPVVADTPEQPNRATLRCIVDETADRVPYLDCVDGQGLYCAIAGNGRGAKACDPIGCVAAHRVLGKELPPEYAFAQGQFLLERS